MGLQRSSACSSPSRNLTQISSGNRTSSPLPDETIHIPLSKEPPRPPYFCCLLPLYFPLLLWGRCSTWTPRFFGHSHSWVYMGSRVNTFGYAHTPTIAPLPSRKVGHRKATRFAAPAALVCDPSNMRIHRTVTRIVDRDRCVLPYSSGLLG